MEWFTGVPASVVLEQLIDDDYYWWLIEMHVNENSTSAVWSSSLSINDVTVIQWILIQTSPLYCISVVVPSLGPVYMEKSCPW